MYRIVANHDIDLANIWLSWEYLARQGEWFLNRKAVDGVKNQNAITTESM